MTASLNLVLLRAAPIVPRTDMTHPEGKLGMAVGVMITLELLVSPPATPIPK